MVAGGFQVAVGGEYNAMNELGRRNGGRDQDVVEAETFHKRPSLSEAAPPCVPA